MLENASGGIGVVDWWRRVAAPRATVLAARATMGLRCGAGDPLTQGAGAGHPERDDGRGWIVFPLTCPSCSEGGGTFGEGDPLTGRCPEG
ncbi:MAG: hypothetical protein NC218_10525 [Acetobacter sp.]|nr:hypothetical protein [Acetobacter sp.]